METRTSKTNQASEPGYAELFTPKLVTVLREGYGFAQLRADAIAGLTVAIVALPLSMAIAIASGVSPAQGLYTAIVGGILVSLLGGSRFQIGGPAGAFIVLVAGTVQTHGLDGLIIATILSGLMLLAIGALKLGTYIKFIPYPVTVGFTAGIAVIIFASQIKDLLGLTLSGKEPGPLLEKLPVIWAALPGIDPVTVALSGATILVIIGTKRARPHWPGMLIAVAGAALATALFNLPVSTIGSVFGGIPGDFPMPVLPEFTLAKVQAVLPNAIAFALLGAIESLLSAVVADGMTGRHHRSNCELVAQGVANMASGLFGGICVTGTIARTATNIRAGAHGPVSGRFARAVFVVVHIGCCAASQFHSVGKLGRGAGDCGMEHDRKARDSDLAARIAWRCCGVAGNIFTDDFPRSSRSNRCWICPWLGSVHSTHVENNRNCHPQPVRIRRPGRRYDRRRGIGYFIDNRPRHHDLPDYRRVLFRGGGIHWIGSGPDWRYAPGIDH